MTLSLRTFQEGMTRLTVAFEAKTDEARIAVYWEELADLSDEAFSIAVKRALREWDKPFALPTLAFLRARADVATGRLTADEAVGQLRRKIMFRYAEARPDAELDSGEMALVRALGMTPARLAALKPGDLDWWLKQTYRPAVEGQAGKQGAADALLGVGHSPALPGGDER